MLSTKDKEWIKKTIKEVVMEALTIEWTIEKHRDEKTGQPLATPERVTEKVSMPAAFLQLVPYQEGALRGLQADVHKNNGITSQLTDKIGVISNILIQTENSLECLAALSTHLKQLGIEPIEEIQLVEESTNDKSDS